MHRATESTAPLQVTSQTTPPLLVADKPGSLFLTFRKPAGAPEVTCTGITVSLPIGELPEDLVADATDSADQIDDYPKDSTGAQWDIRRDPPAATPTEAWPSTPGNGVENIFDPDDSRYYQTSGRILADTSLTVDYGSTQNISTIDIVTGTVDTGYLRMPRSTCKPPPTAPGSSTSARATTTTPSPCTSPSTARSGSATCACSCHGTHRSPPRWCGSS